MSAGAVSSGVDGQLAAARPTVAIDRPLNAILEDPDENKSATTDGGSFFSDDEDTISIPKFTPLATGSAKITFANSSFNQLIKPHSSVVSSDSSLQPIAAKADNNKSEDVGATKSGNLMDFGSFDEDPPEPVVAKKMSRVMIAADADVPSPASDHENSPTFSGDDPFGFLSEEAPNWDEPTVTADPFRFETYAMQPLASAENGATQPVRRLIAPDSPVSPREVDLSDVVGHSAPTLTAELAAARLEISNLVEAVHQKDQNVIDALRKIEELEEDALSEKRDGVSLQRRLETALVNATQLETKNVLLRTQLDEMEQESRSTAKSLRDIALLFNMQNIPADDEVLGIHLKAKVTGVLKAEAELSHLKAQKNDLEYTEKDLIEDLANVRAALSTEKMLRQQAESLNTRNMDIRDSNILTLQAKLNDAERKIRDQEELSHAVAAEARALSEELKDTQAIIDRKDQEVTKLRAALQAFPETNVQTVSQFFPDAFVMDNQTTLSSGRNGDHGQMEQLLEENFSLKEEIAALRRKIIRGDSSKSSAEHRPSSQNVSNRQSLIRGDHPNTSRTQPPDVVATDQNGHHARRVKRELKLLNAALAQVISASTSTINDLKTENLALVSRLHEHERKELSLHLEPAAKTRQFEQLQGDLPTLQSDRQIAQSDRQVGPSADTVPPAPPAPLVEWSETNLRIFLQQLRETADFLSLKKDTAIQAVAEQQQQQITTVADMLSRLQADFQTQTAARQAGRQAQSDIPTAGSQAQSDITVSRDTDIVSSQVLSDIRAAALYKAQEDDIFVLRKMLSERENEIEHWRTVCAEFDFGNLRQTVSAVPESDSAVSSTRIVYPKYDEPPANQRYLNSVSESPRQVWVSGDSQESGNEPVRRGGNSAAFRYRSSSLSERYSEDYFLDSSVPENGGRRDTERSSEFQGVREAVENAPLLVDSGFHGSPNDTHTASVQLQRQNVSDSPGEILTDKPTATHATKSEAGTVNGEPQFVSVSSVPERWILRQESFSCDASATSKLTLPSVDYDAIRQRSQKQLVQLEDLCQRIDRSNAQYASLLPSKTTEWET